MKLRHNNSKNSACTHTHHPAPAPTHSLAESLPPPPPHSKLQRFAAAIGRQRAPLKDGLSERIERRKSDINQADISLSLSVFVCVSVCVRVLNILLIQVHMCIYSYIHTYIYIWLNSSENEIKRISKTQSEKIKQK